jgi:hypothetical protein
MKIPKLYFLLFLIFIGLLLYCLSKTRENLQVEYIEVIGGILSKTGPSQKYYGKKYIW